MTEGFDPNKFSHQVDAELDQIGEEVETVIKKAAKFAVTKIINNSPVWTGDYVLSHRVSLGGYSDSGPHDKFRKTFAAKLEELMSMHEGKGYVFSHIPNKVDDMTADGYRYQTRDRNHAIISGFSLEGHNVIYLYNASWHSRMVEYLPDKYITGSLAPYIVYQKAAMELKAQLPAIIKANIK